MNTLLSLVTAVCLAAAAQAAEIHVAPSGDDSAAGAAGAPLRTLAAARDAVRKVAGKEPVTVIVHDGVHYLGKAFVLTAKDSGTADAPITYRAAPGAKPVVSGGMNLSLEWKPYRDGMLQAQTPSGLVIDQLFVNGTRQHMARYPNYDPDARPYNGAAADAFSPERAATWADPTGGYIHAMHRAHWGGYHYRITGKKPNNEVTYEGGWQNNRQMGMHKSDRFVENIFEELDKPGEWFHNAKTRTLYYHPPKRVDVKTAVFEVARLRHLIELRGGQASPLKFVTLQGLTFRHAARTFMETKEPLLRSDWTIYRGGAVVIDGAEDCTIADCEFDQVGGNAIFVNNYNRRITVRGTHIHGAGASGICFVGDPKSVRNPLFEYGQRQGYDDVDKTPGPKTDNYPADCLVEDCLIHTVSVVEKQATGVQVSMTKGVTIRHCSIYDVGRAGINVSEGTFGGHLIEFCDVFDTVRETGDHGSFNSWGRDRFWGLKGAPEEELPKLALLDTEKSTIRNSRWRCDHGWDVDLDDGSSNYELYNNLFLHGGLKLREGFHRRVWNNIAVNNSLHPHVWYANCGDVVTNNIWMGAYRPARMSKSDRWGKEIDRNLFTSEADRTKFAVNGCDAHSVVGDPMFVDPANGDYRVRDDSPALKLGFKNFPMDKFGVQKASLKAIARTPEFPMPATDRAAASPVAAVKRASVHYWQGAKVKALTGDEFSAFGVSKEEGGIHLVSIPAGTPAAGAGLKTGDLVQTLNGKAVNGVGELWVALNTAAGKPVAVGYVRNQRKISLTLTNYVYVLGENSGSADFNTIPLVSSKEATAIRGVHTRPGTANEPVTVLTDGKLAQNFGPVFRNNVAGGVYKADLGQAAPVSVVSSWSFNQGKKRGPQRFVLFGSAHAKDPGWNVADDSRFMPLAEIDTTMNPVKTYQATSIRKSGGMPLGTYRWLLWVVSPVTDMQENTAYQEFQIR